MGKKKLILVNDDVLCMVFYHVLKATECFWFDMQIRGKIFLWYPLQHMLMIVDIVKKSLSRGF